MAECHLLYRRDGAGPVTYLVECEGQFYLCARGELTTPLSPARVDEMKNGYHGRWVQVSGAMQVSKPSHGRARPHPMPSPDAPPPTNRGADFTASA